MKKRIVLGLVLGLVLALGLGGSAVFAHGGSVNPPPEEIECLGFGNPSQFNAKFGLTTAEVSNVVSWDHCD
jgi:hypothetical protein